jgi:uncharacterized protein (DUF2062 family)
MARFFQTLYDKLVKINDTPQRIALGMGLGVFLGIFPGAGPLAAILLAFAFRVNRASALLGCLLTNTWLSFVILIPALKVGSLVFGINWQQLYQDWLAFLYYLGWSRLFKLSVLKIILPAMVGYLVVSFCLGLLTYLFTLVIIKLKHNIRE